MNRSFQILHLLQEQQDRGAIVPDAYQADLEKRYSTVSNAAKVLYRDYKFHMNNAMNALKRKAPYAEQMRKFQLQKHAKEAYDHALELLRQIPYREFSHHGA